MQMMSYEQRITDQDEEKEFLKQMQNILPEIFSVDDDTLYRKLCIKGLNIDKSLEEILSKWGQYTEMSNTNNYPCRSWHITFPVISTDSFYTELTSILSISKIQPLFFIAHRFRLKNFDEERLTDMLEDYSGYDYYTAQGINVTQFHIEIEQYLNQRDYIKLPSNVMNVAAYTSEDGDEQFTIKDLLFTDKYDLWKNNKMP